MIKKIFITFFTFLLVMFSFVACFGGDDMDSSGQTPSATNTPAPSSESEMEREEDEDDSLITSDDSEDMPEDESSSMTSSKTE